MNVEKGAIKYPQRYQWVVELLNLEIAEHLKTEHEAEELTEDVTRLLDENEQLRAELGRYKDYLFGVTPEELDSEFNQLHDELNVMDKLVDSYTTDIDQALKDFEESEKEKARLIEEVKVLRAREIELTKELEVNREIVETLCHKNQDLKEGMDVLSDLLDASELEKRALKDLIGVEIIREIEQAESEWEQ